MLNRLWLLTGSEHPVELYVSLIARHKVLRNSPVIGHLGQGFEFVSPEIHRYFIESNTSARPYSCDQRQLVYIRAKMTPPALALIRI